MFLLKNKPLFGIALFGVLSAVTILAQTGALAVVTLTARPDTARCDRSRNVTVKVLQNDSYNGDGGFSSVSIAISTAPSHGSAQILSDKSIKYTPTVGYTGNDTLLYKLTVTIDGKRLQSIASVSIDVRGIILLSWNPPPPQDVSIIQGYRMYTGPNCANLRLKTDLSIAAGQVSIAAPLLHYMPSEDLGLRVGNTVSFAVTAYATTPNAIESAFSNCVSTTITRI